MFTLKPHKFVNIKGRAHLHKVTPYMRIKRKDGEIFLQGGKLFDRNGTPQEAPPWLTEEMKKCDPKRLAEVGFKLTEKPKDEKPKGDENPKLSADAQTLIDEHELDASTIEGTGKNGRILKSDVQKVIDDGHD